MNDCEGAEQQHQLARIDPLSLIDRGRRLSFRDSITTYISFGHSFSKIAFGHFSSLFFLSGLNEKKKKKDKSRIAGQHLTTRSWQTLPCFFFFFLRNCHVSLNLKDALYFVELFSVRAP